VEDGGGRRPTILQNGEDRGAGLEAQPRGKEGGAARAVHRQMKVGVQRPGLVDGALRSGRLVSGEEATVVGGRWGQRWSEAAGVGSGWCRQFRG
jgi:hypothetical protein